MPVLHWLPRFRKAYRELAALEQREQWTRTEITTFQLERINKLWHHASRYVPYYRQLTATHHLPEQFMSLEEFQQRFPCTTKEAVLTQNRSFLSEQNLQGHWSCTSGSTGSTTRIFWGKEAHLEMLRAKYRFYHSWGIDIFDPVLFLWGHRSAHATGLSGVWTKLQRQLMDWLRNRRRLFPYVVDHDILARYLRTAEAFQPRWMYAFSSVAYLMARTAEEVGFDCPSLRTVCLSAEPASEAMIATIERAFDAQVAMEYGSIECGLIAGKSPEGTMRVREDQVLLETLPNTKGSYDIVVTVLNNPAFPLFRYQLGDSTDRAVDHPEKGFAVLSNLVGRSLEFVVTGTGKYMNPFRFEDLFEDMKAVRCWQVHQRADGSVSIKLQPIDVTTAIDTKEVAALLERELEGNPVEISVVDAIPRTEAGKHRWITSELASTVCHNNRVSGLREREPSTSGS